ncbi:MAG: hypothetical protein K2W96_12940 [Gemmataceae bacterium]|nr:hypothetical protein [Gemmataceae bacterium]
MGTTITLSSGGKLSIGANGQLDYDAADSFTGIDSFTVTVANALFNTAVTVFINLHAAAAAPNLDGTLADMFDEIKNAAGKVTLAEINTERGKHKYSKEDNRTAAAALATLKLFILANTNEPDEKVNYLYCIRRKCMTIKSL